MRVWGFGRVRLRSGVRFRLWCYIHLCEMRRYIHLCEMRRYIHLCEMWLHLGRAFWNLDVDECGVGQAFGFMCAKMHRYTLVV
jgi:hypothetical protein